MTRRTLQESVVSLETGLYVTAGILVGTTASLALHSLLPEVPYPLVLSSTLVGGVILTQISRMIRGALSDFYHDMGAAEGVALALVLALIFFVPSFIMKEWAPKTGLLLLLGTYSLGLANEAAFAGLYILCGVIHALTLEKVSPELAFFHGMFFPMALCFTLTLEHFYFRTHPPHNTVYVPFATALSAALKPSAIAVLGFLVCYGIAPSSQGWFNTHQRLGAPAPISLQGFDYDLATANAVLLAVVLAAGIVMSIMLIRWLYRRWKAQQTDQLFPPEESPSEIVLSPAPRSRRGEKRPSRDPRLQIIDCFRKYTATMAKAGYPRSQPQTVKEYIQYLMSCFTNEREVLTSIETDLVRARYTPDEVTENDVRRFRYLIEQAQACFLAHKENDKNK
jgi:hypothetical protein